MKTLTFALTLTLTTASCAVQAATTPGHGMAQQQAATQADRRTEGSGVLKAVDAKAGRLKIAHEPIAALHWPAMTMWFTLHGELPQGLHAGEQVSFELEQARPDEWVITRIERKR